MESHFNQRPNLVQFHSYLCSLLNGQAPRSSGVWCPDDLSFQLTGRIAGVFELAQTGSTLSAQRFALTWNSTLQTGHPKAQRAYSS